MSLGARMDSQFTGMWVNFFTAAGIPSDMSASYALTFAENRIQNDMLLELNKEYLRDMGITRMGDVIAILRHSKQVHESAARDRVLSSAGSKVPVAAVTARLTTPSKPASKPSSPASRILEHYTRNATPEPAAAQAHPVRAAPKRRSDEHAPVETVAVVKKARLIRFGNNSQPLSTEGPTNKNVFSRLGNTEAKPIAAPVKPIFSRLGAKSDLVPVSDVPVPKDALKYEGILKSPPTKKTISITTLKNNMRTINLGTMRADETPVNIKEKLALPKATSKSVKFSNKVDYKVIETKFTSVFNKPERRLSMPEGAVKLVKASPSSSGTTVSTVKSSNSVKARLGNKNANNLTITRNVFNRLGV